MHILGASRGLLCDSYAVLFAFGSIGCMIDVLLFVPKWTRQGSGPWYWNILSILTYYLVHSADSPTGAKMAAVPGLRPMSDTQQSWATLSSNFVAQQSCSILLRVIDTGLNLLNYVLFMWYVYMKPQLVIVIRSGQSNSLVTSRLDSVRVSEGCQDETPVSLTSKRGVTGRTCNRCDVSYQQSRSAVTPCTSKSYLSK